MKTSIAHMAVAAFVAAAPAPAFAQGTGSEGFFEIHNDTDGNVVVGFYTNDGSGWSANWLGDNLEPGESAVAEFTADSGACDQLLRVGWAAEGGGEVLDEPISIDVCDASNIYLGDNEIAYD